MNKIEIRSDLKRTKMQEPKTYYNWDVASSTCTSIPTYEDFLFDYLIKNLPCIIKNVTSNWECSRTWVKEGKINYDYIINKYGDMEAPVADCDNITFNSQCKNDMRVSSYMEYLKEPDKSKLLYLKDWHLRKLRPEDKFYEIPEVFASDWLNEYAQDKQEDDFMFVYIGPKNSWTPLHADVYSSYSWSVNVVGRKKWILFPPGEEEKLKDSLGNIPLVFDMSCNDVKFYEIIQEKGDALFVPSEWYHQVTNLEDTISVNHNWVNACNIDIVWKGLVKTLVSVEQEISEFMGTPEFPLQCQLILKSLFGMDFSSFTNFLCYIGHKRLSQLQTEHGSGFDKFSLGIIQIKFDLKNILNVMNLVTKHHVTKNKDFYSSIEYDFDSIKTSITNAYNIHSYLNIY